MTHQNHELFPDSNLQAILPTLSEWFQTALDTGLNENTLQIFKEILNHNAEIQLARRVLDDPLCLRGKAKMGCRGSERRTGG